MAGSPKYGRLLLAGIMSGAIGGIGYGIWQLEAHPVDISPLHDNGRPAAWQPDLNDGQEIVFRARPLSDFSHTLNRPLFELDRRPFVQAAVSPEPDPETPSEPEPAAPAEPPEQVKIMGIKIFHGTRQALIASKKHQNGHWVRKGDSIGGWRILSVHVSSAVISAGTERKTLTLYVDNN